MHKIMGLSQDYLIINWHKGVIQACIVFVVRICNHIYFKVWDEITYPFLNFNGVNKLTTHFAGPCDKLSMLEIKWMIVSKRGPRPSNDRHRSA